jgi:hypothetical protein
MVGVADLEGRLGNLSHATKVCLEARMVMIIADGGARYGGVE